jgi:purine-binding chemotaxis protein CheW
MDIAKIRKKAKEREEGVKADDQREERLPEPEGSAEAPAGAKSPREEHAAEEAPAAEMSESSAAAEEAVPPPPPAEKEGEEHLPGQGDTDDMGVMELLTFSMSNEEFAFRVPEVKEIIRFQRITKVPTMPSYVLGITSLRGKIIPVIDLRERLGLKSTTATESKTKAGKILILAGPKGMIGATIQKILGVVRFQEGTVLDPPGHLSEGESRFIEGVVILEKRFISIVRSYDALDIELT